MSRYIPKIRFRYGYNKFKWEQSIPSQPSPVKESIPKLEQQVGFQPPVKTKLAKEIPHFYIGTQVIVDDLKKFCSDLNAHESLQISNLELIVRASALALKENRNINSIWKGDQPQQLDQVNITVYSKENSSFIQQADSVGLKLISKAIQVVVLIFS